MRSRCRAAVLAALAVLLLPISASASNAFSDLARGIGKAAQSAGVTKVQILPLTLVNGQSSAEGRMIAARLMTELIDQGKVLIVDGDLPAGFPDPYAQAMGAKGRIGLRAEAEAVVVGTHLSEASRMHLDIRLLRVQDRVVLYSANKKVKNEWVAAMSLTDASLPAPDAAETLPVQEAVPTPALQSAKLEALKADALGQPRARGESWDASEVSSDCRQAADEVDRLQSSIFDIKARYVAGKPRETSPAASPKSASLIHNEFLREQFDAAVRRYVESGRVPTLTKREIETLLVVDGRSFEIHRRCLTLAAK